MDMKKIVNLLVMVLISMGAAAQSGHDPDLVMPRFPGGTDALVKYLSAVIQFPEQAMQYSLGGKVLVSFIVNEDGTLRDITPQEYSIEYYNPASFAGESENDQSALKLQVAQLFVDEAVRTVKNMPPWMPGSLRGRYVGVRYTLPITFTIPE